MEKVYVVMFVEPFDGGCFEIAVDEVYAIREDAERVQRRMDLESGIIKECGHHIVKELRFVSRKM